MTTDRETILIKRYASRRLYNTKTSDYITLDEVATYIRDGKDVQIIDRKTGEDLTRQYLLQIITDYESKGENILPINVLMDIVRSYSDQAQSYIPDFLSQSFDMIKQQQQQVLKSFQQNIPGTANPLPTPLDGFQEWQKLQTNFFNQMMTSWNQNQEQEETEAEAQEADKAPKPKATKSNKTKNKKDQAKDDELAAIKKQLQELQSKLQDL